MFTGDGVNHFFGKLSAITAIYASRYFASNAGKETLREMFYDGKQTVILVKTWYSAGSRL
jgi:hypothetical protein